MAKTVFAHPKCRTLYRAASILWMIAALTAIFLGGVPALQAARLGASAGDILISEVLYDPPSGCGTDQRAEWVELYNNTATAISLNGWQICDNNSCDSLPNYTVAAGQGVVISAYQTEFGNCYACSSGHVQYLGAYIGGGLSNSGDRVYILDDTSPTPNRIDEMNYGSDTTYFSPACPDVNEGHSLEREPINNDTNTNSDWADQSSPSPCLDPNAVTLRFFSAQPLRVSLQHWGWLTIAGVAVVLAALFMILARHA